MLSNATLIAIQPSRLMAVYLTGLHLLVFAGLWLGLSASLALICLPILLLHCTYSYYRYASARHSRWVSQLAYRNQQWFLQQNKLEHSASLVQARVWRRLLVLHFCDVQQRHHYLTLFIDSVDAGQWRQLQVMLRHLPVYTRAGSSVSR